MVGDEVRETEGHRHLASVMIGFCSEWDGRSGADQG